VRAGKLLRVSFEAPDRDSAEEAVEAMCRRLLANPVMETADWEIQSQGIPAEEEIA
jgi:phosphoribosylformylglycinamidine synthase PurS subunit